MSTTTLHEHDLSGTPLQTTVARWRSLTAGGVDGGSVARLTLGAAALVSAGVLAVFTG